MLVHPIISIGFKRHGHIGARAAFGKKARRSSSKLPGLGQNALIFDRRTFLAGKLEVDLRRLTVGNRVAKHGIARLGAHDIFRW